MRRVLWILLVVVISPGLVVGTGLLVGWFMLGRSTPAPPVQPEFPPTFPEAPKRTIRLFFATEEGSFAQEERLIPRRPTVVEEAKEVFGELIKGPREGLFPTVPSEAELLALFIDAHGIAYADFNKRLQTNHPGGSLGELLTVYSIVDTLVANFPEVQRVQILIEGEEVFTLAGHVDTRRPLAPRFSFEPGA